MFRGALRVPNFFVASLCTTNCISTIKLLAISKTAKLEFFGEFRRRIGVVERVPRYLHRWQFFSSQSVGQKLYSCNKIIGDLKNGEIRIFFVYLQQVRLVLGVFLGALRVPNFFVASLFARNCISAIKLLAFLKTVKLEFFSFFDMRKGVVGGEYQ